MADMGIRINVNRAFVEMLHLRATGGNTVFRKSVIAYAMEEFGITLASAATHYNHAFKVVKAANPELVEGLGRAEDKKGGRKPKVKVAEVVAAPVLLLGYTPTVAVEYIEAVQTEFVVKRKSDGATVAEGLSFDSAKALVAKAKAAKKSALYYV